MVKVHLVNYTPKMVETMAWAFKNMHCPITESIPKMNKKKKSQFVDILDKIPHKTVMEFVNTVWLIEEGTRAFQQQLTRTRMCAFSIQSLRIVEKDLDECFVYPEMGYLNTFLFNDAFRDMMLSVSQTSQIAQRLKKLGVKQEDIRALYPLNTTSPITMAINLRALQHMLEQRLCQNAQGEFREVAKQMLEELLKVEPTLKPLFGPPCAKTEKCMSPVPCGKYPAVQYNDLVTEFIKG